MKGYSVEIKESSKELTAKERVMLKDTTDCKLLDNEVTDEQPIMLDPDYYVILGIHNEHSSDKDYENMVVVDKSGERYKTGSQAFISSFTDIMADMEDCDEEWSLKVYRRPSKNYNGTFITCSII